MGTLAERAEVKRMRAHPAFQGRGLGTQIPTAVEARARQLGYTRLHLDTTVHQTAAQRLYATQGFREIGRGMLGGMEVIFISVWRSPWPDTVYPRLVHGTTRLPFSSGRDRVGHPPAPPQVVGDVGDVQHLQLIGRQGKLGHALAE